MRNRAGSGSGAGVSVGRCAHHWLMTEMTGEGLINLSSRNQPPVLTMSGKGRLTVRAAVRAVASAVDDTGATPVDIAAIAAVLQTAVRQGMSEAMAAERAAERNPLGGRVGES